MGKDSDGSENRFEMCEYPSFISHFESLKLVQSISFDTLGTTAHGQRQQSHDVAHGEIAP